MLRLILHFDLDAFYAAVEQRDRPDWRGLPVVVGAAPGKRGVVATYSYEARRFGVHSAMPISEAERRLPPQTVYVRPDMDRYAGVGADHAGAGRPVSGHRAGVDRRGLSGCVRAGVLDGVADSHGPAREDGVDPTVVPPTATSLSVNRRLSEYTGCGIFGA